MTECDLDRRYGLPENVCAVGGVVGAALVMTMGESVLRLTIGAGVLGAAFLVRRIADLMQNTK